MTRLEAGICCFVLAVFLGNTAMSHPSESGFLERAITIQGTIYRYKVYVPPAWNDKQTWPIILFLHGAGERGGDAIRQTEVGLGPAIKKNPNRFPCVVVFPQCPTGSIWATPEVESMALGALDLSITEFNGDSERVYLTGLSMGGYGTWSLASKNPSKFAALAPVCGGVRPPPDIRIPLSASDDSLDPYEAVAKKIGDLPIWIFHGGDDPVVPVSESRNMAAATKKYGASVKYTEYPGVGHNSWDSVYNEPDFMTWLLSHRIKQSGIPSR